MGIEGTRVKITTKQEFYDVETVCFDNGYSWYTDGHPRRDYSEFNNEYNGIYISSDDMDMCATKIYDGDCYTAKEFIEKYGKDKQPEKRYRIKTKKEFIDRYGSNWRDETNKGFPKDMDYSLGKRLSKKHNQEMIDYGETTLYKTGHSVGMDMVILDSKTRHKPTPTKISKLLGQVFEKPNITLKKSLFNKKRTHLNQTL